ncbi:uncharacterized protein LOC141690510 [Apium graveolens]|uniref:uncharacterized protein LOC141690510 n=1 Tax=Apium graveolens TaxID=4045 RepID=UPI003D7991BB
METRFTCIVDELSQLGKSYTQNEKNQRVLKSLPPSWKVKVTTIKEMHNLNDYKIDNLFGNLRAYEEDNLQEKVIPKVEYKKKNMALKSILINEEENDDELNEEIQNLDESKIALITRQLRRKGMQNTNVYNNNTPTYTPPKQKEQNTEEIQEVCYECKQPGHFKRECPKLVKGRSLVAENGWDLSEDEEAPEASEEIVNLYLMAIEDASTLKEISTSNQEVCLTAKQDLWYLDSGCSRHMNGNKSLFNNIKKVTAGSVTFGDSSKGIIIGIGDIGNEHFKISDVQLVTGLKYNLLSISQLCDNGNKMTLGCGIED